MGGGIAQVVAASGRRVSLHDPYPGAVERGLGGDASEPRQARREGRRRSRRDARARSPRSDELVAADLMIEAIIEDAAAKEELFRRADERARPVARSSPRTRARSRSRRSPPSTGRPERVIGMHFFNPVPVLKLVEVIRAVQTSDETAAAIVQLARDLGKEPAEARDFPGFVSNRILMPFINEAAYALLEGVGRAGGDRHDREARLRASARAARARRPDRARHVRRDHGGAARAGSATRSTRRARCCASTCRRDGSAGSQAAGSTRTDGARAVSARRARRSATSSSSEYVLLKSTAPFTSSTTQRAERRPAAGRRRRGRRRSPRRPRPRSRTPPPAGSTGSRRAPSATFVRHSPGAATRLTAPTTRPRGDDDAQVVAARRDELLRDAAGRGEPRARRAARRGSRRSRRRRRSGSRPRPTSRTAA